MSENVLWIVKSRLPRGIEIAPFSEAVRETLLTMRDVKITDEEWEGMLAELNKVRVFLNENPNGTISEIEITPKGEEAVKLMKLLEE